MAETENMNNPYLPTEEEIAGAEEVCTFGEDKPDNSLDIELDEDDDSDFYPDDYASIIAYNTAVDEAEKMKNTETSDHIGIKEEIDCSGITYISEKWHETPCGIIECQRPHIGAVYLEIHAERNSMIVFSDSDSAIYCYQKYKDICFCPDLYESETVLKEWNEYKGRNKYMKILKSFNNTLGFKNIEKQCFLLLIDMDTILSDHAYEAWDIMDFYLKFPQSKRCIYTSDSSALSYEGHEKEDVHILKWGIDSSCEITVKPCKNVIGVLKQGIEKLPVDDKVLVIYSSVNLCRQSILNLSENIMKDCCIVCNNVSIEDAGDFFFAKDKFSGILPARITFIPDRNISLEINEKFHLIMVSDTHSDRTILSIRQILKLSGLCSNGCTLIHNISYCNEKEWQESLRKSVERGRKIAALMNSSVSLSSGDKGLERLFTIIQNILQEKSKSILKGRMGTVPFVRKARIGWTVNNIGIDSQKFIANLLIRHYSGGSRLSENLQKYCSVVPEKYDDTKVSDDQAAIAGKLRTEKRNKAVRKREALLDHILTLDAKSVGSYLKEIRSTGKKEEKKVARELGLLLPYMETSKLVPLLRKIKTGNTTGFKNFNNKVMFWALEDEHPLKLDIFNAFKVGGHYTNKEIIEKLNPIIMYHLNKHIPVSSPDNAEQENKANELSKKGVETEESASGTPKKQSEGRKLISLFKCMFEVKRPRQEYIILSEIQFNGHKKRIGKDDNNLVKYFML